MSDTRGNLNRALAEINKSMGGGAVRMASDIKALPRVSSNVVALDAMLGGGIPMSRITNLVGQPSGGKSSLAQFVVANAQRIDRNTFKPLAMTEGGLVDLETGEVGDPLQAVWIDSEGSFTPEWAMACGIDLDRLPVLTPGDQERSYDMLIALIRSAEADVIVLDSIAAMSPNTEVERSTLDELMGVGARINNKGLRKLTAEFNRLVQSNQREFAPMVILINQLREKLGGYGNPEVTPGGRGLEFFASLSVKVWPEALSKAITVEDDVVARRSTFKVEKNKVTGVHGSGQFTIYLQDAPPYRRGDTNTDEQVLDLAVRHGFINKSGSWLVFEDGTKVQGNEKAMVYLREHPEAMQSITTQVTRNLLGA